MTQPTPPENAPTYAHDTWCNTAHTPGPDPCPPAQAWWNDGRGRWHFTPSHSGLMAQTPHVLTPAVEYDQLTAVVEAARALVASEATRHDATVSYERWIPNHQRALTALTAAVDALDTPGGGHVYLSTGCLHGEHDYCRATTTAFSQAKAPARCKFCSAPCICPCHAETTDA